MHGSLLPRYRGRAPVNWAVLHGERETGATLHYMTEKPDAGDIVAQTRVPILPDDTAREVFDKVTVAAEITLDGVLPALIAGTAPRRPQDLASGSYFGGRRPEDGIIDWKRDALVDSQSGARGRAALPRRPHHAAGIPARVLRTRMLDRGRAADVDPGGRSPRRDAPGPVRRRRNARGAFPGARRRAMRRGGARRALRRCAGTRRHDRGAGRGHV